jgi:hypothetical protein
VSDLTADARALAVRLGLDAGAEATLDGLAAALAGAEHRTTDREHRREIRRVLYRLRQHGVVVPEPEVTPAAAQPALGPTIEGFVSAVDGQGDRLVWLVRERAGGELTLVAADVNEPGGLRDLRVLDVTRKQLRAMRERFRKEAGLLLVEADWRRLDALVAEAQVRSGAPEARQRDYARVRARLTSAPPLPPEELVSSHASAPEPDERTALVAASAALLSEPELRTWWPRPEAAGPVLAEIGAIRESPLVLSEVQQEERLREVLARATPLLYPPDVTARRLRATAYVFAETGRGAAARQALAVAGALEAAPGDAGAIPLLQALAHQGLGAHLAAREAERRESRAGSLVLTPSEIATAGSPSRPPRARG